jgi:hypothetical protein
MIKFNKYFIAITSLIILGASAYFVYTNSSSNQNTKVSISNEKIEKNQLKNTLSKWNKFTGENIFVESHQEFEYPPEWKIETSGTTTKAYDEKNNLMLNAYIPKLDISVEKMERYQALEVARNQIIKNINTKPTKNEWVNNQFELHFGDSPELTEKYFITSFGRTPYVIYMSSKVNYETSSKVMKSFNFVQ